MSLDLRGSDTSVGVPARRGARSDPGARSFPRAAVDVVMLRLAEGALEALVVEIARGPLRGRWAFPGGRVAHGEPLEAAARREIREHTAARDLYVEQLFTFGEPLRDPLGHVVSTTYLALVPAAELLDAGTKYASRRWMDVRRLPPLAYDHDSVARVGIERLQSKLSYTNVAYALMPREFTIAELQGLYELALDKRFDRRNFRKKILASGLLAPLRRLRRGAHRPAALYAFRERTLRWIAGI